MEVIETNRIKTNNNGWKIVPFVFLTAGLFPDYVAPVVLVFSVIYTMCKKGFQKKSFNSFSIGYTILFYICWMIVGMLYANSVVSSLASIGLWILMFSGMWMCGEWINTTEKMEKVFLAGALAGGISGLVGVFQIAVKMFCPEKFLLVNPIWTFINLLVEKIVPLLPDFISSNMGSKTFILFPDRACGTFSNPLFFATFEVAMIPFAMYFFVNGKKMGHRILGLVTLALTLCGLASSYSRGPYVVAVVVFILLLAHGGKKALKILALGAVCATVVLIAFKDVVARLLTLGSTEDFSINTRKQIYDAILEKIPDKFIAGYGTGFDSVREILHNEYNIRQPHAHNILLEIQMENGIIGVVLFLAICLLFAYTIFKLYKMKGTARGFAITLFVSFIALCMCGMTDCIFYGLKPLQYMMMVLGLAQACVGIFSKKEVPVKSEESNEEVLV